MIATAKLFQNGKSQAVRLPKEFRFEGEEVYIRKVGNTVILSPLDDPWESFFEGLQLFTDDFMAEGRQQPAHAEEREPLFDE